MKIESSNRNPDVITVVIAEDETVLRMIASEFLTDAGFVVIEMPHASAVLDFLRLKHHSVHLLFTDIQMPGMMNGLELAHHVSRTWPHIALIISSGEIWPEEHELPQSSRFIRKPYDHENVVNRIRAMVTH